MRRGNGLRPGTLLWGQVVGRVKSVSADDRTLTLDVPGSLGAPTVHVDEGTRSVHIDIAVPMHRGVFLNCEGQMNEQLKLTLKAPLAGRSLTGSHEHCG
jgi:hypothetical protein